VNRRLVGLFVTVGCLIAVAPACSRDVRALEELRAAINRTEQLSNRFLYNEVAEGRKLVVQGIVEDDLRYKARLSVNGQVALDEVVVDDALADRFVAPELLQSYVRKGAQPPAAEGGGISLVQALRESRWVLDTTGAPAVLPGAEERSELGDDPIFDALNALRYVEEVATQHFVVKFNPDALDYRPKEDPFPTPEDGSGVTRYDTVRFDVPRRSDASAGNQRVPSYPHFRKMSVYVKDGLVIEVREVIDVASRLDDLERNYGIELPGSTTAEKVETAVQAINVVLEGQGEKPLRIRTMALRLEDLGRRLEVALPDDPVEGDLSFLINRGAATVGAAATNEGGGSVAGDGESPSDGQGPSDGESPSDGEAPGGAEPAA